MRRFAITLGTAICLLLCPPAEAANRLVLPPELCTAMLPTEQRLLDDLDDRRLDEHSILEAALIASGSEQSEIEACRSRLETLLTSWPAAGMVEATPRQRAKRLFELMHRELLTGGYRPEANHVAHTIQQGAYNCLSATILWLHLAHELGIESCARQLPGHVQSVVLVDGSRLVVELTSPGSFSGDRSAIPSTGVGRDLDDAAVVAAVYYNRGLSLLAEQRFAEALTATYLAHRLDPESVEARGNVLAILNNWALALAERQQLRRALWLLEQGRSVAPEHESFRENLSVLRQRSES
jgi:hypothetical protein